MGVPLFFAISGAIFLHGKTPRYKNFKKVISSIIIFSLISLFYVYFRGWPSIWGLVYNSINKPVFYHLWFFYTIIPVYFVMTIVDLKKTNLLYIILSCFILFTILNPRIGNVFLSGSITSNRFMLDGEVIYYILYGACGAAVAELRKPTQKNQRYVTISAIITLVLSVSFIAYSTSYMTILNSKFSAPLYSYNSIPVFLSTFSALIIFKNINLHKKIENFLRIAAKHSLEIYGVHAIFLDILLRHNLRMYAYPFADLPLTFIVVLSLCYIFSLIMHSGFKRLGLHM